MGKRSVIKTALVLNNVFNSRRYLYSDQLIEQLPRFPSILAMNCLVISTVGAVASYIGNHIIFASGVAVATYLFAIWVVSCLNQVVSTPIEKAHSQLEIPRTYVSEATRFD